MSFETFDQVLDDIFRPAYEPQEAPCKLCAVGDEPVKLRRRWVHHFPDVGRLVVCEARTLKRSL
jgi:hypothetical protein